MSRVLIKTGIIDNTRTEPIIPSRINKKHKQQQGVATSVLAILINFLGEKYDMVREQYYFYTDIFETDRDENALFEKYS